MTGYSQEFIDFCHSVTAKRARTVIDHILEHGFITTKELKDTYGYNHPPRAVRDVRELGINIETFRVTGSDGRKVAAYRFGEITNRNIKKLSGRTGLSKKIKKALIEKHGCRCFIYLEEMKESELQIDHRIPYEIAGDNAASELSIDDFMLLSGSANRAKSWSCEHCDNWNKLKNPQICQTCYWAYPESYSHISMQQVRRLDLIWQGNEIEVFEKLQAKAHLHNKEVPVFVKEILQKEIHRRRR